MPFCILISYYFCINFLFSIYITLSAASSNSSLCMTTNIVFSPFNFRMYATTFSCVFLSRFDKGSSKKRIGLFKPKTRNSASFCCCQYLKFTGLRKISFSEKSTCNKCISSLSIGISYMFFIKSPSTVKIG